MASYIARRFVLGVAVLLVAMTILFLLIYTVPGDPATIALGPRASELQKEAFRLRMGLDQPLAVQALNFLWSLLHGDLGTDILNQRPVTQMVLAALPKTVLLAVTGLGWAALIGIPLGIWAALRPDSWTDRIIGLISTSVVALPAFLRTPPRI